MKKLIIICLILVLSSVSYAEENFIRLVTYGTAISMPDIYHEKDVGVRGSILVKIQGQVYAIEDTEITVLENIHFGDRVQICFCLDEFDKIGKLYIINKI